MPYLSDPLLCCVDSFSTLLHRFLHFPDIPVTITEVVGAASAATVFCLLDSLSDRDRRVCKMMCREEIPYCYEERSGSRRARRDPFVRM